MGSDMDGDRYDNLASAWRAARSLLLCRSDYQPPFQLFYDFDIEKRDFNRLVHSRKHPLMTIFFLQDSQKQIVKIADLGYASYIAFHFHVPPRLRIFCSISSFT